MKKRVLIFGAITAVTLLMLASTSSATTAHVALRKNTPPFSIRSGVTEKITALMHHMKNQNNKVTWLPSEMFLQLLSYIFGVSLGVILVIIMMITNTPSFQNMIYNIEEKGWLFGKALQQLCGFGLGLIILLYGVILSILSVAYYSY